MNHLFKDLKDYIFYRIECSYKDVEKFIHSEFEAYYKN